MKMTGEQHIAASRQRVWEALNDPDVLRQCIPGCQSLGKEGDDRFQAVAEVKIGPIGARFKGDVSLSDLDAPNGYTITGKGNGLFHLGRLVKYPKETPLANIHVAMMNQMGVPAEKFADSTGKLGYLADL